MRHFKNSLVWLSILHIDYLLMLIVLGLKIQNLEQITEEVEAVRYEQFSENSICNFFGNLGNL